MVSIIKNPLEIIIHKALNRGWKLMNSYPIEEIFVYDNRIIIEHKFFKKKCKIDLSFHELFSMDSGIMPYIKWKEVYNGDSKLDILSFNGIYYRSNTWQYHIMRMGLLNEIRKEEYVIEWGK